MKKVILAGIMAGLLISLAGCGETEVKEDSYEEFVAEYYQSKLALHFLQIKYEEVNEENRRLRGRDLEFTTAIDTLNRENEALRIEAGLNKALGESQKAELVSALNTLTELQAEKHDWHILAKKDYEAMLAKYNAIAYLYPPTHFANKDELVKWRANLGERVGCLELQDLAFGDGYIVSVAPNLEYCVVVAGDTLYKITPGDKELVEKIGKVE